VFIEGSETSLNRTPRDRSRDKMNMNFGVYSLLPCVKLSQLPNRKQR
jgi:hypothetical protein